MLDWNRIMTTTFVRNSEEKKIQKQLILRNSLSFLFTFFLYISPSLSYVGSKRNVAWKMRVYHFFLLFWQKVLHFSKLFYEVKDFIFTQRFFFSPYLFWELLLLLQKRFLFFHFSFEKHFTESYNLKMIYTIYGCLYELYDKSKLKEIHNHSVQKIKWRRGKVRIEFSNSQ